MGIKKTFLGMAASVGLSLTAGMGNAQAGQNGIDDVDLNANTNFAPTLTTGDEKLDFADKVAGDTFKMFERFENYADNKNAEIEKQIQPSLDHLAVQHGETAGCYKVTTNESGKQVAIYDKTYLDSMDGSLPMSDAKKICDNTILDMATDSDLKHLQNQGEDIAKSADNLKDFQDKVGSLLAEKSAINEYKNEIFGERIGPNEKPLDFEHPTAQKAVQLAAEDFQGLTEMEDITKRKDLILDDVNTKVNNNLDKLENDKTLSVSERLNLTVEVYGSMHQPGIVSYAAESMEFEQKALSKHFDEKKKGGQDKDLTQASLDKDIDHDMEM